MLNPIYLFSLLIIVAGCGSVPAYRYEGDDRAALMAEVRGELLAPSKLITLELASDLKAALDDRIDQKWHDKRKLIELRSFLFSKDELGIQYDARSSLTATETYRQRLGNCLAMTNLFVAAGRYVGIDAHYQTIAVRPTWDQESNTIIRYEHIVATGKIGGNTYVLDFLPEFSVNELESERVSDLEALALYFNNLGAEAIVDRQPEEAVKHLQKALAIDATSTFSWNNMGAAMRRLGNDKLAEFAYILALEQDQQNFSALSNLSNYYETAGRTEESERIAGLVANYRRRNPYFHYYVSQLLFAEGSFKEAEVLMQFAIKLKRNEPEFHEAVAKIYLAQGNEVESERSLKRAKYYRSKFNLVPVDRVGNDLLMVETNG